MESANIKEMEEDLLTVPIVVFKIQVLPALIWLPGHIIFILMGDFGQFLYKAFTPNQNIYTVCDLLSYHFQDIPVKQVQIRIHKN